MQIKKEPKQAPATENMMTFIEKIGPNHILEKTRWKFKFFNADSLPPALLYFTGPIINNLVKLNNIDSLKHDLRKKKLELKGNRVKLETVLNNAK